MEAVKWTTIMLAVMETIGFKQQTVNQSFLKFPRSIKDLLKWIQRKTLRIFLKNENF